MRIFRSFTNRIRQFAEGESGSIPIEGVLAFTFLAWWYMASFTFFDALRQRNITLKASYTIADMMSRETGPTTEDPNAATINHNYVNGLNTLFDYLTFSSRPTWIRVSSIYWDADDNKYRVDWSDASGTGHVAMTTPMLQNYKNRIPVVPTGDSIIVVETYMAFNPVFNIGVTPRWISNFITTSPRFASCVPWNNLGCGTDNSGNWVNPDITDVAMPPPSG